MKRKIVQTIILMILLVLTGCGRQEDDGVVRTEWSHTYEGYPVVYAARHVSADGLLSAYKSLEASFHGTAIIKLSETDTDEDIAWTELIGGLSETLDEPVIAETPSSLNFSDYDCTIVLSHFRSDEQAGFNGAVKQTAIISMESETTHRLSSGQCNLEGLAKNAKETVDDLDGHILYINVMDRVTVESAGVVLPESNTYDIGILASYDPVALDQACIDLVAILREGTSLLSHIADCNGLSTLTYGEQIGLGSRTYALTILDD